MGEQQNKGFNICDRRFKSKEKEIRQEEDKKELNQENKQSSSQKEEQHQKDNKTTPLQEPTLLSLIFSINANAYMHMEPPEEAGKKAEVNLPMAKHYIDLIAMLEEKTKGNRTDEETKIIQEILYALRMHYVSLCSKK
ncbi:MAG: DUF1844 domain-containing protein [bacterium]